MTHRSRLAEARSLGLGAGVVVAFIGVLEATRRLDVGPGVVSERPFVVALGAVALVVFAVTWLVTESAFES